MFYCLIKKKKENLIGQVRILCRNNEWVQLFIFKSNKLTDWVWIRKIWHDMNVTWYETASIRPIVRSICIYLKFLSTFWPYWFWNFALAPQLSKTILFRFKSMSKYKFLFLYISEMSILIIWSYLFWNFALATQPLSE